MGRDDRQPRQKCPVSGVFDDRCPVEPLSEIIAKWLAEQHPWGAAPVRSAITLGCLRALRKTVTLRLLSLTKLKEMRRRFGLARGVFRLSQVRPDVQSFPPRRSGAALCHYPSSCVRSHVLVWLSLASVLHHAKLHPRTFGAFQIFDQARNAPLGRMGSMCADLHLQRKRNRKLLGKLRKHRAQSYRWARR